MGLKTFNVEMPDRGIRSRVRGFFMLPQHIGSALWIPSGSLLRRGNLEEEHSQKIGMASNSSGLSCA